MSSVLKQKVTIQPGGIVHIQSAELTPGATADVIIIPETPPAASSSLARLIGTAKGGFASPSDVDAFIRRERDAWHS
ncbi:MAG TPA: hypothetical protein VJ692_06010 [Nitrospiraceae bacterium]|nr:hypothetical protein [Nitrospiraceae bacterium]